jgi:zinc protease
VTEWTASAIFAPQNLPKVRKAFDEEVARALKDGFTEAEVKQGVESLLSLRRLSRAQDAGLVGVLTTNATTGRDMKLAAQQDAQLGKLTASEVNAALRKYIKPETFVYVVAGSLDK